MKFNWIFLSAFVFLSACSGPMSGLGLEPSVLEPLDTPEPFEAESLEKNIAGQNTEKEKTDIYGVFINIHLEPGMDPGSLSYVEANWDELVLFVKEADSYSVDLTIHFSPQWILYALEDSERVTLVRSWIEDGHEIGFHHHGPSHPNFDGYTNSDDLKPSQRRGLQGTVDEIVFELQELVGDYTLVSASMKGADQEVDWPSGLIYSSSEDGSHSEVLSEPRIEQLEGENVLEVLKMGYAVGKSGVEASLSEIETALMQGDGDHLLGLAINNDTLSTHQDELFSLFDLFEEYGVKVHSLRFIMDSFALVHSIDL